MALTCLVLLPAAASPVQVTAQGPVVLRPEEPGPGSYRGLALAEALMLLQAQGLRIIFSSDLVRTEMIVEEEPQGATLYELLEAVLEPHGLEAEVGPGGSLLVVKRTAQEIGVRITSPSPFDAVFDQVPFTAEVSGEAEIDRVELYVGGELAGSLSSPPYSVLVDIGSDNVDRRFTAVAYGRRGARASDSIVTSRIVLADQMDVALQQLYVTVTRGGSPVVGLRREAFRVYDEGTEERIALFEQGEVPLTAAMLIDASESMRGEPLAAAIDASRLLLERMSGVDEAMLMLFSDRTIAVTPFSRRGEDLLPLVEGAVAQGGTALNDHLYAAIRLLDPKQGRRVIILLSDGADVLSALDIRDVAWKIRRSDVLIYWLRLEGEGMRGASFSSAWRDFEGNRREWVGLEDAVDESGGRIEVLASVDELDAAFDGILGDLRSQYILGYYPSDRRRDGTWRTVRVRVDVPGVRVRTRAGYIDR